jgi:hypothetical protein
MKRPMKRALFRYAVATSLVGGAGSLLAGSTSCAHVPDENRFTLILQPDFNVYQANVDTYLRRRCGTLDCHGQPGRAYRMYGREGFRLYNEDAGLISGVQPTTPEETRANFQAIVGLEPEEMSRLIATQGEDPKKLLFLRKPLRLERHKGGPAMAEDDPGFRCVQAWLRVPVIRFVDNPDNPDEKIPEPIPPDQRGGLGPNQLRDCKEAEQFP